MTSWSVYPKVPNGIIVDDNDWPPNLSFKVTLFWTWCI